MQGPEGRPPNVSPARKGWEIDLEEDPSAVGAALNRSSALSVSLGAYPDFLPHPPKVMKSLGPATTFHGTVALSFVIPSVPGFPTSPLSLATTYVVLPKENHMHSTEAATLDRKSGEAEGSAVPRTFPGNVFRQRFAHNCHSDRSAAKWKDLRWHERRLDAVMSSSPSSRRNSNSTPSPNTCLQIPSVSVFEKIQISCALQLPPFSPILPATPTS
jgi:hypothetical protein